MLSHLIIQAPMDWFWSRFMLDEILVIHSTYFMPFIWQHQKTVFPNCKPGWNNAEHATIARFKVLTAMWLRIQVCWDVVLNHWICVFQHFEGSWWCLHLQVDAVPPLNMTAPPWSFKMSETTHQTTQCYIPGDLYHHARIVMLRHVVLYHVT